MSGIAIATSPRRATRTFAITVSTAALPWLSCRTATGPSPASMAIENSPTKARRYSTRP
jgi:hypothetical protein